MVYDLSCNHLFHEFGYIVEVGNRMIVFEVVVRERGFFEKGGDVSLFECIRKDPF